MAYATCSALFGDSSHIRSGNVQPYRIAERASFEQLCKVAFECFAAISARARDPDYERLAIATKFEVGRNEECRAQRLFLNGVGGVLGGPTGIGGNVWVGVLVSRSC